MVIERFESLFSVGNNHYLYVQHTADDPEYDFDFTLYDRNFRDVDGGVIGQNTDWSLKRAAREIIDSYSSEKDFDKPTGKLREIDLEQYRDRIM